MKVVWKMIVALSVSALLASGCSWMRRAGDNTSNAHAGGAPADAANGQQAGQQPPGGDAQTLFQRGMEAYRKDRDREAVEAFAEAARLDPDFAEAHYRLGLAHAALGEDEEADKAFKAAVEAYEKTLKQDPKNSAALFLLGLTYTKLGEYQDAVRAFKDSIKNSPEEDDDKYFELGFAHYKLAQYAESINALNKALEINPDYYAASDLLERARAGRERREAFLEQLERRRKQQNANINTNANAPADTHTNANSAARNTGAPPD